MIILHSPDPLQIDNVKYQTCFKVSMTVICFLIGCEPFWLTFIITKRQVCCAGSFIMHHSPHHQRSPLPHHQLSMAEQQTATDRSDNPQDVLSSSNLTLHRYSGAYRCPSRMKCLQAASSRTIPPSTLHG